jgi:hypothetical protein
MIGKVRDGISLKENMQYMTLKEIELDFPYRENSLYVNQLIKDRGISIEEARRIDYNDNWKVLRRRLQLATRCMTSLVERKCFPIKNQNYWKILIECVEHKKGEQIKNLLGVCAIQTEFDFSRLKELSEIQIKKMVLEKIYDSVADVPELADAARSINNIISKVSQADYNNEWYWEKTAKKNDLVAKIKVNHGVESAKIYLEIYQKGELCSNQLIEETLPDEREYSRFLGDIVWDLDNNVNLVGQDGKTRKYNGQKRKNKESTN